MTRFVSAMLLAVLLASPAFAQDAGTLVESDTGDTAWILISSALVLLMTLPGLALFYGGRVRAKNVLSVALQCGAVAAVISVLWVVTGYTLAFGDIGNGWFGNGRAWMLIELTNVRYGTTVPESAFVLFQMGFAIFAAALMVGAWAERARLGWVVLFCAAWSLIVYAPVAHWVWGGGWLASTFGTMDFAGGLVVHTTAGVSALVAAALIGPREGFADKPILPHAPVLTMIGAALLWVGWFGFTGGSALSATDDASSAIINTHLAACVAALVWLLIERIALGKCTTIGWGRGPRHDHARGGLYRTGRGNPVRHARLHRLLRRAGAGAKVGHRRYAERVCGPRHGRNAGHAAARPVRLLLARRHGLSCGDDPGHAARRAGDRSGCGRGVERGDDRHSRAGHRHPHPHAGQAQARDRGAGHDQPWRARLVLRRLAASRQFLAEDIEDPLDRGAAGGKLEMPLGHLDRAVALALFPT